MYCPDRWCLIHIKDHYRVFGSWHGGYAQGDSWRMNSGIVRHERTGNGYNFYGTSGSLYSCGDHNYGTTTYGHSVLESYKAEDNCGIFKVLTFEEAIEVIAKGDWE